MKNTNQMTRKECWKAIDGSSNYEVSTRGKVRNAETGELLNAHKNKSTGYVTVLIYANGKQVSKYVHRLVA